MDTRTYQEVKKDLEARRQARRARIERFQLKEALEFAEIERLEKINQTRAPSGLFERLPQELRDQIWGYCVAPGKVFLSKTKIENDTRFEDFDDYEKPHYPLLAVSRSIRKQAAKVFFEENQMIFAHTTTGFDTLVGGSDDEDDILLNSFGNRYLRSASFTFDVRSPPSQDVLASAAQSRRAWAAPPPPHTPWSSLTEEERTQKAHDMGSRYTYGEPRGLMEALIWRSEGLKSIELNLTNCYCPSGCCRAVDTAFGIIFETGCYRWPGHVRVLGTKNRKERDYVHEIVGCRYISEGPNEIVFEKFEVGEQMVDPPDAGHKFWGYLTEEDLDVELEREEFKD